MKKALLIAEKPSVSRDLEKVYKKLSYKDDIKFTSAKGHLVTLAYPEEYNNPDWKKWSLSVLPIIPEKYKYKAITTNGAETYLNNIKKELKNGNYDYIINACDAGREGELIFELIYEFLDCKLPVKRMWFNEMTEKGITKAFANLRDNSEFKNLKLAAKYRQIFDWLLGMNLTRVVTIKTNEKISVGRVMTPTLAILAQRENEILNFKSTTYWEIESEFKEGFKATWINPNSKENRVLDKNEAQVILDKLSNEKVGKIKEIINKENLNSPTSLHDLGELQKEANKTYGYSLSTTLSIAQSLYEKHKLITYPRTDSKFLNKNITEEFEKILNTIKGIDEVTTYANEIIKDKASILKTSNNNKYIDDSKVTDHHAIIPTQEKLDASKLTKEELNVYMLVVKRFLSIFMKPYKSSTTSVTISILDELFKIESKMLIEKGYRELYPQTDKEVLLPPLKENQVLNIEKIDTVEKQTKAPARYTDRGLLTAMENAGRFVDEKDLQKILKEVAEGIGTPATRAGIVDKLLNLGLVEKNKNNFSVTALGLKTINSLEGQDIISPALTAVWENKLKSLENNNYNSDNLLNEMVEYTKKCTLDFINIDTLNKTQFKKDEKIIGLCPKCNNNIVEGKKYYRCENYKDSCDFIIGKVVSGATIKESDVKKILNGEKSSEKTFKYKNGNKGKASLILHPNTKNVVFDFTLNTNAVPEKKKVGICPKCKKEVNETKNYYLCESYKKECDFILPKTYGQITIDSKLAEKLLRGEESELYKFKFKNNTKEGKLKVLEGKLIII